MNLKEAVEFTFENRPAWIEGRGAKTARINSNHVLRILGGDMDVAAIDTEHFTKLSRTLRDEGKKPATINRITAALSTVLTELRVNGFKVNPPAFRRQKEPKGRVSFFEPEEVDQLLEAASQRRDYFLLHDSILFGIKTGCRQGELLKLEHSDIDFDSMQITFRDTKNGRDHVLPLNADLVPILQRRIEYAIDKTVFPWRDKDMLLRTFKSVRNACGIGEDKVWHTLRHTTATWLVGKNVPLRVIMNVLNHSNVNTTLRYAKAADKATKEAIDLL